MQRCKADTSNVPVESRADELACPLHPVRFYDIVCSSDHPAGPIVGKMGIVLEAQAGREQ